MRVLKATKRFDLNGPLEGFSLLRLAAEPGDSEARYALAANQVMQGDIDGALDNLLLIMQKDRAFGKMVKSVMKHKRRH